MNKYFYTPLFILLSGFLFAQNDTVEIKGKVLSSKKKIILNAELYLKLNDTVYKTITDGKGEYKFLLRKPKSKSVAQLYINSSKQTVCSDVKRSSFLCNHMEYKIDMAHKIEYAYDFELKTVNIDYSTPSILFQENMSNIILDVKYGKTSAKIDEAIEYFYKLTKQYPKMVLDIEGMTSTNEKTKDLSASRAKYIAALLIAKGVPPANIKTQGRGTSLPEVSLTVIKKEKSKSKADDLHAMNRRVIIKILNPGEEIQDKEGNHF
jgi:outer membrane protein OmpA-like peptidoglycan-associated protein